MSKIKILSRQFLLLLFLISGASGLSQNYLIKGGIINDDDKPIAFASVHLSQKDTVINTAMTNENGEFELKAKSGKYNLQIHQFDTLLYTKAIDLQADLNLKKIKLDASIALDEVVVRNRRKILERKADRLRFNVEDLPIKNDDGFEIIKQTPGLLVQNESISIIGKKGVRVMIDGQLLRLSGESLLNYLKNLDGDEIKAIEVITNPPAKYSAEGNSGLLNILLKKSKLDHWSNSISSSVWQSKYTSYSLNDNFYYKKNKLSVGAGLSLIRDNPNSVVKNTIYYPDHTYQDELRLNPKSTYFNPKFGVEYKLNDRITSGIQLDYFKSDSDRMAEEETAFLNAYQSLDSLSLNDSKVIDKGRNYAVNYHLVIDMDSLQKKKFRFDFDLLDNKTTQKNRNNIENYGADQQLLNNSKPILDDDNIQHNKGYYFKLDMVHPTEGLSLNYGIDFSFIDVISNITYFESDQYKNLESDSFNYKERTQSAYFSAKQNFGEKWEVQLGLRAEYAKTKGISDFAMEEHQKDYAELFPTGYIAYNLNPKHSFSLNYGRRITRPFFMYLNPYESYESQYKYTVGNPNLMPSFSHNLELNYLFDQSLNVQLYYNRTSGEFGYLQFADPQLPEVHERPENYAKDNIYGLSLFYSLTRLKWWQSLTSFNYNYSSSSAYIPEAPETMKGNNAYFNLNNTFKITDDFNFNGNYYYFFPGTSSLTKDSSRNHLDLGVQYSLLDKNMNISLMAQDVFKSSRYRSHTYSNGMRMNSNIFVNNQIKLILRYKFGNKKMGSYQYEYNEERNRM